MREQLISYVNSLFAGNPEAEEIRQEILQNTMDRYDDLVAEGKNPQAAYGLAIAGIGDVSELLNGPAAPAEHPEPPVTSQRSSIRFILWLTAAAVYFIVSFLTRAWFITWLIFPIAWAVSGLIHAIFDLKEAKNNENKCNY